MSLVDSNTLTNKKAPFLLEKITVPDEINEIGYELDDHASNSYVEIGWRLKESYSAKILDFDENSVKTEWLIDKDENYYQTRRIPIELFEGTNFLTHGSLIKVLIYTKPRETKMVIQNGKHLVNSNDFPDEKILDNVKDLEMFKFKK